MLNSKKLTVLAGLVIGVSSMSAQAVVVFDSFSYTDTAGTALDNGDGSYDHYGSVTNVGLGGYGDDFGTASAGPLGGAFADSDAWVDLGSVFVNGNTTSINGAVSSYASAGTAYLDQNSYAYADAVIDLDFSLDGTYSFSFYSNGMDALDNANVYYELYSYGSSSSIFSNTLINGIDNPWINGSLSSGNYRLIVEAISDADGLSLVNDYGEAYADFGLELTAVPVPAAVWLFGSGLIGLAGFARRKAK